MYIGGTLYALSTKYIKCTLEVVRNAQNSSQIDCSDSEDDAYICAQSFMLSHADVPVATDNHPIVDRQSRRLRYDSWTTTVENL